MMRSRATRTIAALAITMVIFLAVLSNDMDRQERLHATAKANSIARQKLERESNEKIRAEREIQLEKQMAEAKRLELKKIEEERAAKEAAAAAKLNRLRIPLNSGWWTTAEYENQDEVHVVPHDGLDFAPNPSDYRIYPIAKGEVIFSGWGGELGGCGNWVAVYHSQLDITSIYCHMSSRSVEAGKSVTPDTEIGIVGSTGMSTGPHLHLGLYRGLGWVEHFNPRDWLHSKSLI